MWHEVGIALCLVLVIEGMMPFLFPAQWKEMMSKLVQVEDSNMRLIGLSSMVLGTALLYLVN